MLGDVTFFFLRFDNSLVHWYCFGYKLTAGSLTRTFLFAYYREHQFIFQLDPYTFDIVQSLQLMVDVFAVVK